MPAVLFFVMAVNGRQDFFLLSSELFGKTGLWDICYRLIVFGKN